MNIKINGQLYFSDNLNYEQIHNMVLENVYDSIPDAVISKLSEAIQSTDWYKYDHPNFDLVKNFESVKATCQDNADCYLDSLNWTIMNKSEVTKDIYKFISHRASVVRDGIENNFIPNHHLEIGRLLPNILDLIDMIDWNFVLDCISFI